MIVTFKLGANCWIWLNDLCKGQRLIVQTENSMSEYKINKTKYGFLEKIFFWVELIFCSI